MAQLARKEFEREYGVDLLPYSTSDIKIGEIMDWEGLIFQSLDFKNYTIADVFEIPEPEIVALNNELKNVAFENASFPNMVINSGINNDSDLQIPGVNLSLAGKVEASKVKQFSFKGVKSKRLTGAIRRNIVKELEVLKEKNFTRYKEKIRNFLIIETLFYATEIQIDLEKNGAINLSAELNAMGLSENDLSIDNSSSNTTSYTVKNINCPFAAELVRGKQF